MTIKLTNHRLNLIHKHLERGDKVLMAAYMQVDVVTLSRYLNRKRNISIEHYCKILNFISLKLKENYCSLNDEIMTEKTIVRDNLMTQKDYSPYCGNDICKYCMPRTRWHSEKEQFICNCGWVSEFPLDFIERYKKKWHK